MVSVWRTLRERVDVGRSFISGIRRSGLQQKEGVYVNVFAVNSQLGGSRQGTLCFKFHRLIQSQEWILPPTSTPYKGGEMSGSSLPKDDNR